MIDTIRLLCRKNRTSVSELEANLGLGKNTIYRWDKSAPSIDKAIKVADYFDISLDELCGRKRAKNENISSDFAKISQNRGEKEIFTLFFNLNEEGQEVALNILKTLANTDVYKKCNLYEVVDKEA